jgi:curved DNA-binding protein CbpA
MDMDPYEVLGVARDADVTEIRRAYKDLAFKLHPDKSGSNPRALEQMKLVNEAYAVLSNKKVRVTLEEDSDWKEHSTTEDKEKVWEEYSKQVEEYYRQVQKYLEEQLKGIQSERARLSGIEQELRKKEDLLRKRESDLDLQLQSVNLARGQEVKLKEREDFLSQREAELDELMRLISKSNSIAVSLSQASKVVRMRTK